jgi:hypothetical protein
LTSQKILFEKIQAQDHENVALLIERRWRAGIESPSIVPDPVTLKPTRP